jgi:integrase
MASVFKKQDSWWIDYYYLGKRHRQKIGAKRKAEDALSQIRTKIAAGDFVAPDERQEQDLLVRRAVDFADFARREFLPWSAVEHATKHHDVQKRMLEAHLIPYFKGLHLHEITAKRIEDYKPLRLRKVVKATVNRELSCLKKLMRKAVEWGVVDENPAQGVKLFKETPQAPRLLETEEVAALLAECQQEPCTVDLYAFVATIAYAGLRKSEVLNMRWDWIDYRREQLTVRPSKEWHTKNYKPRTIPLNSALLQALRAVPRRLGVPYVFATPEGTVYQNVHWIVTALGRAVARAGIVDGVGFHQLRHCFCSHAQMQGVVPITVQAWMGHQDLRTTLKYSHLSPAHERAAIQAFSYRSGHQVDTSVA